MTYAKYGLIQASDFNGFVGGNPTTTANTVNAVWATGGGVTGYGQTPVANVPIGNTVTASDWSSMISTIGNTGAHQGTSLTNVIAPSTGNTISTINALSTNLVALSSKKLNAAIQGTSSSTVTTYGSTWLNFVTFTHTVSFANGDAARYFFNAGGQISITPAHPTGSGINQLVSNMATSFGTMVFSAPASGNVQIGTGTNALIFNGVTKVGGNSPTRANVSQNSGYYALSTSNTTLFTQLANSGGMMYYVDSFVQVKAKTNGTQGSNGDNGSVITFYTTFDEVPGKGSGLLVASGTNVTLTVRFPETTYIANTWGTVSVAGSSSGS